MEIKNGAIFTTKQAEGAWPNGSRVIKVKSNDGDGHAVGSLARVIGSLAIPKDLLKGKNLEFAYFLAWDDDPDLPVCCIQDGRLELYPKELV